MGAGKEKSGKDRNCEDNFENGKLAAMRTAKTSEPEDEQWKNETGGKLQVVCLPPASHCKRQAGVDGVEGRCSPQGAARQIGLRARQFASPAVD